MFFFFLYCFRVRKLFAICRFIEFSVALIYYSDVNAIGLHFFFFFPISLGRGIVSLCTYICHMNNLTF